jgi:hypothetical protein
MVYRNLTSPGRALPEIVSIILRQAYRQLKAGAIPRSMYDRQIERLTREELAPRGLKLEVGQSDSGQARFIIRSNHPTAAEVLACVLPEDPLAPELAC